MTEKKTKRFDMRLSADTLTKLRILSFSEGLSMSTYLEMLILSAWDNQMQVDEFFSYTTIIP